MSSTEMKARLRHVEEALRTHSGVREAVAFPLDEHADSGYAAAVVPKQFATAPELREYAREKLGDAHSPRVVMLLAEIPTGDHEQTDIAAIKQLMSEAASHISSYEEPQTASERELAAIIGEVLDLDRVGATDDFLEIGGDSLHAVQVVTLIEQRMGVELLLEELFDASTTRSLALLVEERRRMPVPER